MSINRKLRVLWLGHWHSDQALHKRKAVNQAATAWSRGFIDGLKRAGCDIRICTHCWEQYWPVGDLLPGRDSDFDNQFPLAFTRYLNVPGFRNSSLIQGYKKMVARELSDFKPDVVLTYNLYPYHSCLSDIIQKFNCKWIPVVLDQADPSVDNWAMFRKQSEGASGIAFLSYWGFKNCPLDLPLIHFDGGVAENVEKSQSCDNESTVVYSGKFDCRYGGLDLLFEIFNAVESKDCKFILTGKDPNGVLKKNINREKRAEFVGFLNDRELHAINVKAKAFVNPRPPDVSDNRMAFPSKLLGYLRYGKPIISTWTDGLSPEYRDLLWVPDAASDNAKQYALLIDKALTLTGDEARQVEGKISGWIKSGHTWELQARKLVKWILDEGLTAFGLV